MLSCVELVLISLGFPVGTWKYTPKIDYRAPKCLFKHKTIVAMLVNQRQPKAICGTMYSLLPPCSDTLYLLRPSVFRDLSYICISAYVWSAEVGVNSPSVLRVSRGEANIKYPYLYVTNCNSEPETTLNKASAVPFLLPVFSAFNNKTTHPVLTVVLPFQSKKVITAV